METKTEKQKEKKAMANHQFKQNKLDEYYIIVQIIDKYQYLTRSDEKEYAKVLASKAADEAIKACEYNHVESWNTDWWMGVKTAINNL